MEWFKMPVNLRRDPVLRNLSAKAWDGYLTAVADSAEFETDGKYVCGGKMPSIVKELVEKGALVPFADNQYEIYRWADLMPSKAELDIKRSEARERMQRSRDVRANKKRTSREVPTSLSTSVVNGSQEPTSGRRDLAYEALGDCWQSDWQGLPPDTRGRINDALGSLRNVRENRDRSDEELAAEIRRRWAKAESWKPDWEWTPQTFLRYWRKLSTVKAPAALGESDPAFVKGTPQWEARVLAEEERAIRESA